MSGKKYLLDTNAVIALLAGDKTLSNLLKSASWIGISIITYIEFLSFSRLSNKDKDLFSLFCKRVEICSLVFDNKDLLDSIINYRKESKVKLPDAIISMTAVENEATLLTQDIQLLKSNLVTSQKWSNL